tara:strand:- start:156 stop:452 length:297 start_codon:yes stop_codon:yes gene_type:complete
MNIKCPKCNTVFEISDKQILSSLKRFKCSVCNHIWDIERKEQKKIETTTFYSKRIILLNLILIVVLILSILIFRDELEYSDIYWKNLYSYIDILIPIK